jgi:hypothetical protein
MSIYNNFSKSVGVCSVFKPGNASWLGGPFGSPSDSFSTKKKTYTRRIKADTFDFNDTFKVL